MSASRKEARHYAWHGVEEDLVRGLYLGLLGREPDVPGMLYWISRLQAGESVESVAAEILHGDECRQRKNKGMFQQSYLALRTRVAEWAQQALSQQPLTIADVSAQKPVYENDFYAELIQYKIPHHIYAFGPVEFFGDEHETAFSKVILSPEFICDGNVHQFYLNEPDSVSSFLPFHPHMLERFANANQFSTMRVDPVQTLTLDHVLGDKGEIDLIKLNINGMELLSLQHAAEVLQRTNVVHCNVSFIEMYEGQSGFKEVEQFLHAQGFELIDFYDQRHYAFAATSYSWSRDVLGQIEAVFFRRLDANASTRSIVSQSLLALLIYQKPSLAGWLAGKLEADGHPLVAMFDK